MLIVVRASVSNFLNLLRSLITGEDDTVDCTFDDLSGDCATAYENKCKAMKGFSIIGIVATFLMIGLLCKNGMKIVKLIILLLAGTPHIFMLICMSTWSSLFVVFFMGVGGKCPSRVSNHRASGLLSAN